MGESIGKIYETDEYEKFSFLKGNRIVKKKRKLRKFNQRRRYTGSFNC